MKEKRLSICGFLGFAFSLAAVIFAFLCFWFLYLSLVAFALSLVGLITSSLGVHISKKKNGGEVRDFSNFGLSLNLIILIVATIISVIYIIFIS
ncbi:MAG: hypothetical protein J6X03_03900 [Bacilli bacterium]|nr:hypothetical protein [Bacilli bacterium]